MEEKDITHEESLQLIKEMIVNAKSAYYSSGAWALLWGITNVICFSLAYVNAKGLMHMPFNPFYLMGITILLQIYFDRRDRRSKQATSYLETTSKYVWITFAISITLLTITGSMTDLDYFTLPMLLMLFAMPTFITGCIFKFPAMIVGGFICWILFIVTMFYRQEESFLLVGAGAFFAWVIPGIILRLKHNKRHGV